MKQRKILDINEEVNLEVKDGQAIFTFTCPEGEVNETRIALDDLKELRNWLDKEIFNDRVTSVRVPHMANIAMPHLDDLDKRVFTTASSPRPGMPAGIEVTNLTMDINKAKEAFSPEYLMDGGPGNK
jgi:hypothetical protein